MQKQNYKVSSQESGVLLKIFLNEVTDRPAQLFKLLWVVLVEVYSRVLGSIDYHIKKKNPFAWDIASTTKNLDR